MKTCSAGCLEENIKSRIYSLLGVGYNLQ